MKKTLRNLMLASASLLLAGNVSAATAVTPATGGTANPFAYALSSTEAEGAVTINYSLNADATAVAINLIGNQGTVVKTVDLDGDFLAKGAHTTTIELAGLSDGCYNWEVKVTGEAKTEVKEFFYQSFWHPSGLDIDNNPENASFGTLFVAEGYTDKAATNSAGTYPLVSAQADGSDGGGLYMFTPGGDLIKDANGNARFHGKGLTVSKQFGTKTSGADFARVAVAEDGRIFVTRHNDSGDYILSANSVNDLLAGNGFTSLVAGMTMTNAVYNDADGNFLVGPNQGFDVKGSGADTKLVAITCANTAINYAFSNTRTVEYAIGTAITLPSATPVAALDKKYTVSYDRGSNVQYDNRGGIWYCQFQSTPADNKPALVYIDANGEQKFIEGTGGKARRKAGIAVSPDGTKLAASSAVGGVVSVYDITFAESGAVTLTETYTITLGGNNMYALTWDAVGNLYAGNASDEYVKGISIPRENNDFTTKAAAQYAICYTAPVVPTADPLYITGENIGGNWSPANAAEFEFDGEKYVITVDENTTQFKISTVKGTGAENDWDIFNAGNLAADAAITNGGTVNLSVNKDGGNLILPWAGVWTITVAADLSTLTATTDTPEPAPVYDPLYMLGHDNVWDINTLLEIPYDVAKGAYYIKGVTFTNTACKISTVSGNGSWDAFNAAGMCSSNNATVMIGTPGSLYLHYCENIPIERTGTFNITIDMTNATILLEEQIVYPDALFLCGNLKDANWDPSYDGAILDPTEEGVYAIKDVELVGADGGDWAYFSFNTAVGDWDKDVNKSARYGAESPDQAVTIGENMKVVNGGTNPCAWKIKPGVYSIVVDLVNMTMVATEQTTGVESIEAENNAPAVYYNLQGVEVANPENGVYIMKQGNKVTKVVK